ncbi:hypothetical protein FACS1894200_12650 [Spirochaetia bacterium]|nr:hypothetical protein FACS1894200_12650 [Spirochaetia bacterium]
MKGTFFLGQLILPMCLCAGATLFKAGCYALLHLLFPVEIPTYTVEAPTLWVELSLNTVIAPFFFAFLRLFSSLLIGKKEN